MIVIAIYLIKGEYHAAPLSIHWNETVPEWPPSPWSILREIAMAGLRRPSCDREAVDKLLGALAAPPNYQLPTATVAEVGSPGCRAELGGLCLEVGAHAPAVVIWSDACLDSESVLLLQCLLRQVEVIGRTPVRCSLLNSADAPATVEANCWYVPPGGALPQGCDYLCIRAAVDGARAQDFAGLDGLSLRAHRMDPPLSRWVLYARPPEVIARAKPDDHGAGLPCEDALAGVTLVRYAIEGVPVMPVEAAVRVAELARRSAMAQYGRRNGGGVSPILAGKDAEGRPLSGHLHVFYIPTDEDGDGFLDHLSIYTPAGFDRAELEALMSVRCLNWGDGSSVLWLGFRGLSNDTDQSGAGPFFSRSRAWVSATPYVLTRYPKATRAGVPKMSPQGYQRDGPEDQVIREWDERKRSNRLLPCIVAVEVVNGAESAAAAEWAPWSIRRGRSGLPSVRMPGMRLRIVFEHEAQGPLALGYGCHYGLGLFAPEREVVG